MKVNINGKVYDPYDAEYVRNWKSDENVNDFDCLEFSLMKTNKGDFFLYGYGGARTWLAVPDGNMWVAGFVIVPISAKKAAEMITIKSLAIVSEIAMNSSVSKRF